MKISDKMRQRIFRTKPEDQLPKTIHHRRIYILPTKRGWVFLASLLLMLVASINYALSLGYALSFLLTGLFAATLLETYKNLAGIVIEEISAQNVFAGETAEFNIRLGSGKTERHDIEVQALGFTNVCSIKSDASTDCGLLLPALTRGKTSLGRLTLTSRYPLGLWYTWCYAHTPAYLLVYPQPETNPPPLPLSKTDNAGDKYSPSIQGDVAGLRDYQAGDSPSHIAWKSAARGQGLQVKTFENAERGGDVWLSQNVTKQIELEKQLSRLSAWVLAAEKNHSNYALTLANKQLPLAMGEAHKKNALESLALHGLTQ